ncbi:MAG: NADPH-dependent FMN reductase [Candidatus Jorgensenbacteria bacterium GW2011_GWA1_48_11]|uniref:NADPH-dependent FMN reductase n=1 Tax=Candidatus Jorgensenbacteria bacterium GW2011_GWA1_48_11 TaxID=1618660 RepID=A0A0G1X8U3_9BACT|nr:MAG: NADPH-dependent FMN reductase [Candidatus Jorgensenbacteria bacterium GW2011_GWA1_48_11]KKW12428.1 MAG: NADPH-dependent FMN reductase [Candidatus Jorgensenbacteria bacterium GW2011_GWB1_49_9]
MIPLKIQIIIGSTREGRFGDKPANWIFEEAKKTEGVEAELLDMRDYPLPFFDQPISPKYFKNGYPNEIVGKLAIKIAEADGFIIVTPEYNHGYPAVLKNTLDWIYYEWNNKPIGFVSYGTVGGARAVEQLRQVAIELQMAPIREAVHIPLPWTLIDEKGNLKPGVLEPFKPAAENFLNQLIWWAKALKAARG